GWFSFCSPASPFNCPRATIGEKQAATAAPITTFASHLRMTISLWLLSKPRAEAVGDAPGTATAETLIPLSSTFDAPASGRFPGAHDPSHCPCRQLLSL